MTHAGMFGKAAFTSTVGRVTHEALKMFGDARAGSPSMAWHLLMYARRWLVAEDGHGECHALHDRHWRQVQSIRHILRTQASGLVQRAAHKKRRG